MRDKGPLDSTVARSRRPGAYGQPDAAALSCNVCTPGPGEIRKLLRAPGLTDASRLLVLDEPTNHLDLLSIEALEAVLQEYPCGLPLVTRDLPFP